MEAAAVGVTPPGGGPEQLVMFLVLHPNAHVTAAVTAQASGRGGAPHDSASQSSTPLLQAAQPRPAGSQDTDCDQQQGEAGNSPKAMAPSSLAEGGGQDEQATDVGVTPRLDGLWEAISKAKVAAASAASRVADLAAGAVQSVSTDAGGAQQAATAQAECSRSDLQQLKLQCQQAISTGLNPLFKLDRVLLRDALPRTASNKVMRRLLRDELRLNSAKL